MKATALGSGLYRSPGGTFWHRPWVHGRRTWRKLDSPNAKGAREILAARLTDAARHAAGLGRDPYAPPAVTIGELLLEYEAAGCPTRHWQPLAGKNLTNCQSRLSVLKTFWRDKQADSIAPPDCLAYWSARQRMAHKGHGGAAVDRELSTLKSVLTWAVASGKLRVHPLPTRIPRFRSEQIRHCRECAPANADELHELAAYFFESRTRAVLGWQVLLTAFTGCRTSEVLRLRWDAVPHGPGHVEGKWLWLERSKRGVNPFALITPALASCLRALAAWRDREHPGHPFYLPSPVLAGKPVGSGFLAHDLPLASETILGHRVTPHGLRAYYVTARRSQGASDAQIAAEIGDATGAALIASTYGAIPPNWQGSAQKLGWIPKTGPAWKVLEPSRAANVIQLRQSAGLHPGPNSQNSR